MQFLVSKTYEIVTEESAREGDAAERGYEFENRLMDLREVVAELSQCSELSAYPMRAEIAAQTWASTEPQQDPRTGDFTSYSFFIRSADGEDFDGRRMMRLYRLAKLA